MIYYCVFWGKTVSGGIRVAMEHTHFLKKAGFAIEVVAPEDRIDWYKYKNFQITTYEQLRKKVKKDDWLVFCGVSFDLSVIDGIDCRKIYMAQGNIFGECTYLDMEGEVIVTSQFLKSYFDKYYAFSSEKISMIQNGVRVGDYIYKGEEKRKNSLVSIQHSLWKGWLYNTEKMLLNYNYKLFRNIKEDEVRKIFVRADIYLHLPAFEGFGYLPLEAMLGQAVVVSCANSLDTYAVEGETYIKAEFSVDSILKKVEYLFSRRDEMERIRKNAFKAALSYDWEYKKEALIRFWKERVNI